MASHHHPTTDGAIHYVTKRGKGRTIVAIHGVGSNHTVWTHALKDIPNPQILIDLHGHGKSTAEWTHIDETSADITSLLRKMKVKNPIIIGNSFGGSIAIRVSKMFSASKLILISPYLEEIIRFPHLQRLWLSLFTWVKLPLTPRHVDYADHLGRTALFYTLLDLQRTSVSTWTRSALAGMKTRIHDIPSNADTILVIGTKDALISRQKVSKVGDRLRSVYVDANHLILSRNPQALAAVLIRELSH